MKIKKVLIPLALASIISIPQLTSCTRNNTEDKTTESKSDESVNLIPTEIAINSYRATTVFNLGEKFDSTGLTAQVIYSNNTLKDLTNSEFSVDSSNFNSNVCGTYDIYVIYITGTVRLTKTYQVTVKSIAENATPHVQGIEASITKNSYKVNENFSESGLKVIAHYSDGTSKDVTSSCNTDSSLIDKTKIGVCQYKVEYSEDYTENGKTETKVCKTFILVTYDATINKIELESGTTTLEQDTVGPDGTMNTLDISDWKIKGTFMDNDYNYVYEYIDPSEIKVSNFNSAISGKQTATISYTHGNTTKTATVEINVTPIKDPTYIYNPSTIDMSTLPLDSKSLLTEEYQLTSYLAAGISCKFASKTATFGTLSFTQRMATNGAGKSGSKNYFKFTLDKDSTVAIIGCSSDSAKIATTAGFYDSNGTLVSDTYTYSTSISKYKYNLKAGTYYFYDTAYAVQIYYIQVWENE